jgi:D-alanyl-D-alanine endopeptidase (penicillin-binding protein 7)
MSKILLTLLFLPLFAFAEANTVVYNVTNDTVIRGSLDHEQVSIASISKLMTVYTVLNADQDLTENLRVVSPRTTNTRLVKGMTLSRLELIELSLISSDNLASITLAENYPGGKDMFIHKMNENAKILKMYDTKFVDPTGLSSLNFSSIRDIVTLTKTVSQYDIVKTSAMTPASYVTATKNRNVIKKKNKKKRHVKQPKKASQSSTVTTRIHTHPTSTYFGHEGIFTIKTGFTNAAGFCITMLVVANEQVYNITVLGAKTKKERQRYVEKSLKIINA